VAAARRNHLSGQWWHQKSFPVELWSDCFFVHVNTCMINYYNRAMTRQIKASVWKVYLCYMCCHHNRATMPVGYCPSTASFSLRPHCENGRRDRFQEYHNCFPFGELEETTRTSSNYVEEDYPARPEIKQFLPGWGANCGSESSTLETDVCVWRYASLVVHATQEEEEVAISEWLQFLHVSSTWCDHCRCCQQTILIACQVKITRAML